jgi:prepilin-type processing-associated H-X9-DG protein
MNCLAAGDRLLRSSCFFIPASVLRFGNTVRKIRRAFSLVELLVVIGIVVLMVAILLPLVSRARSAGFRVACASNLRQVGVGLTQYAMEWRCLPVRANLLAYMNPHVMQYQNMPDSVAAVMEKYTKSRAIFYCPVNSLGRNVQTWWPYTSGTIAGTYQYPFWLSSDEWVIPYPDYRKLTSDRILASDYLGATMDNQAHLYVVAWNHEKLQDGSPVGMNTLFADGHVQWHPSNLGWQVYGVGFDGVYWFYPLLP